MLKLVSVGSPRRKLTTGAHPASPVPVGKRGASQQQVAGTGRGDCYAEPACGRYRHVLLSNGTRIRFNIACGVGLPPFVVIGTMYEFYIFQLLAESWLIFAVRPELLSS